MGRAAGRPSQLRTTTLLAAMLAVGAAPPASVRAQAPAASLAQLYEQERWSDAELVARAHLALVEASEGAQSLAAASAADSLCRTLWEQRKPVAPEDRARAERTVALKERLLGPTHAGVGESLLQLGMLVGRAGELAESTRLLERTVAIREQTLGPRHEEVAVALVYLSRARVDLGQLSPARDALERAIDILQQRPGPEDDLLATALNDQASIFQRMGMYAQARPLFEHALALVAKLEGEQTGGYANLANNLAILLHKMGLFAQARALFERAIAITAREPDDPGHAIPLVNLAILDQDMGLYAEAEPLFDQALDIYTRRWGPEHRQVATTLNSKGALLQDMRRFDEALELYRRALAIKEKVLPANHPSTALTLNNLGSLLQGMGRPDEAADFLERALAMREATLGAEHPDVAQSLVRLSGARLDQGRPAEARRLAERALAFDRQALGEDHPSVARDLQALAMLDAEAGRDSLALAEAVRAADSSREHLRRNIRALSEEQAVRFRGQRQLGLELVLALAARGGSVPAAGEALDALVRSRALVLDEMAWRRQAAAHPRSAAVESLTTLWLQAQQQWSNVAARGPAGMAAASYQELLQQTRAQADRAELALAAQSDVFRTEHRRSSMGLADVARALEPGDLLVSYARFRDPWAKSSAGVRSSWPPAEDAPARYLALVLGAGDQRPQAVALGDAGEVDACVTRWRGLAGTAPPGDARSAGAKAAETACRDAGKLLRARIWDVLPRVAQARRVFVVPDGALNLVNWLALPADDRTYLVDHDVLVHLLATERDLGPVEADPAPHGPPGLLALGDPDFDRAESALQPAPAAARSRGASAGRAVPSRPLDIALASSVSQAAATFRGPRPGCPGFDQIRWLRLPATAREVDAAVRWWRAARPPALAGAPPAVCLKGRQAGEHHLKLLAPGNRVLHLSTHGFFLGDDCSVGTAGSRGIGGVVGDTAAATQPRIGPLISSGLVLAGANRPPSVGTDEEDGILTVEEIAALDLTGVEWVVLSACDTGVGRVQAGEGVFGLRRAFQIAGAHTLLLSLWPVEDESTRRWMEALYRARFQQGVTTPEAIRSACRELLSRARATGSTTHPFAWGGFVATGDWR